MSTDKKNGRLISAALIMGAASLGSRLVGLLRERVLTTTFGAGNTLDAFVAAFRLPDLIFNLVVVGALSAAFIPLFTEKLYSKSANKKQANEFAVAVLNTLLVAVIGLCLVFIISAPFVVHVITPGFTGDKLALTVTLSRIMALQPILLTISFIFSGILNSYKKFAAYALAPIVYNLGIIFGVWYLVPRFGVSGLGWGVVLGALLHLLIQLPGVLKVGFRWTPLIAWHKHDVKVLWKLMVPRMLGLAADQINLLVVTIIGSGLLAGSISVFYLADNIQSLPLGIFGLAFAQAAFPALGEQYAKGNTAEFRHVLTRSFRYILFFVIPISVFFILLRSQIVRVLYGNGLFSWQNTIMTYQTLTWLSFSVFAQATVPLLTRAFYVRRDTKTPVIITIISILINASLGYIFSRYWGIAGLAIAFSFDAILNFVLLLYFVRRQIGGFDDKVVLASTGRIAVASIAGGLTVQLLKYPVSTVVDMQRLWGISTQLGTALMGGAVVYLGVCWLLGSEELTAVRHYVPRRWRRPVTTELT